MAGSITAALFLKNFITDSTKWIHLDIYGWTPVEKPAHPQGAEVMPVRALLNLVMDLYGKTKF
jgi:leucyl aminopeptidase